MEVNVLNVAMHDGVSFVHLGLNAKLSVNFIWVLFFSIRVAIFC